MPVVYRCILQCCVFYMIYCHLVAKISNSTAVNRKLRDVPGPTGWLNYSSIKLKVSQLTMNLELLIIYYVRYLTDHFSNNKSWNDLAPKVRISSWNALKIFLFLKNVTLLAEPNALSHSTPYEEIRRWGVSHPTTGDTVEPRDTSEVGTGTRTQEEGIDGGKNNTHSLVFPAISRLQCVNVRGGTQSSV